MTDAIVIGGGAIGLAIAWELQRAGMQTRVLERGQPGRQASWAAGGMLSPVSEVRFQEEPLLQLGLLSLRQWPDFAERLEAATGQAIGYDRTGNLLVALDRDEVRQLERLQAFQQELGLPARWLAPEECLALEPLLSARVVAGVLAEHDHQVDNRRLVDALERAVRLSGGQIDAGVEAASVVVAGSRAAGVQTAAGRLEADWVIVAAGAWSGLLDGIPVDLRPPIRPVRGQMVCLQMDAAAPLVRHVVRGRRAYLVPRADGRLLVGATSEERGFELGQTAGGVYDLLRGAYELVPGTYELPLIELWSGLRPASRDGLPLLGPTPIEGLLYATGHYRGGILLTPVTAWAIAGLVASGALPAELAPFAPSRFLPPAG